MVAAAKKIATAIVGGLLASSMLGMFFLSYSSANDIVDNIFRPSLNNETVINLGQDKDAVGDRVFKGGLDISIGGGDGTTVDQRDSLLVSLTRTLLRITLILGITMTLWNGVQFVLAAGDETKQKTTAKHIGYIALGIILALSSVAIIYLLTSVSRSIL